MRLKEKNTETIIENRIIGAENQIAHEMLKAFKHYGSYKSLHEIYGVLLEEIDEFFDHVRARKPNLEESSFELIQIAAVALRGALELMEETSDV